jgi:hypothetical protein
MSYESPAGPASAPPPVPTRPSRTGRVLGILAGVFVLLFAGCFALFRAGSASVAAAQPAAESFLSDLEKGDTQAAVAAMSAETRAKHGADALKDVLDVLAKRHGRPTGHDGPKNYFVGNYNGATRVQLVYNEAFEKGDPVPVQVVVRKEGDAWHIDSFNFRL